MTFSFLDDGSHPVIFYESFFTLCFNQLQYLHFLCHQILLWMFFSSFLYVTFFTSICEITYVPRGFRTDDSWMICYQLTPTLYHCATEDNGHVLLFVYLYLNFHWFFTILCNLNSLCNLILCTTWFHTLYVL